jgi:hypothetical protein
MAGGATTVRWSAEHDTNATAAAVSSATPSTPAMRAWIGSMRNAAGNCTARAWQKRHATFKTFAGPHASRFMRRGVIKTRVVMVPEGVLFPQLSCFALTLRG